MSIKFPVHLFEEHSSTLPIWWQYRSTPRVAVYLDAHLDLQQIDKEKIFALEKCQTVEQAKALEAPHHLNPSARYAFGIENFLYPATKLNLIERLIWVAPPHIPRSYSPALLEYVQQMDGISFEELTGFVKKGVGSLRGKLLGLDITICHYDDLANLEIDSNYYLDIDIDYFVEVPSDRLWVDPGKVLHNVVDQLGIPEVATISRAVISGFTPVQYRFLGDYIYAVLRQDDESEAHYQQLYQACKYLEFNRFDKAFILCREAIESRPNCAASYFISALASNNHELSVAMHVQASELEKAYSFDLSREACGFPHRRRALSSVQLRELEKNLEKLEPETEQRAFAEVAMAQLCAGVGMLDVAWKLLQKQTGDLANHSDVLLAIAGCMLSSNKPQQARQLLELAAKYDKNRSRAIFYLGELAFRSGDATQALAYYTETHQLTPAWMQPIENQRLCYKVLGETGQVNDITALIEYRKRMISHLPGMS